MVGIWSVKRGTFVSGLLLLAVALTAACGGDGDSDERAAELDRIGAEIATEIEAEATAVASVPSPDPTEPASATPTPTSLPEPTPVAESAPTPIEAAELVALEYWREIDKILDDPNNVDLTRAIQLEAPGTSMEDWALRFVAQRLEIEAAGGDDANQGTAYSEVIHEASQESTWSDRERFSVDLCLQRGERPGGGVMTVTVDRIESQLFLTNMEPDPTKTCSIRQAPAFAPAEAIALEYYTEVRAVAADARTADLTRLEALASPAGSLVDYGQRLTSSLLDNNHYLVLGDRDPEVIEGSVRFDTWTEEAVIAVDLCVDRTGLWRDFDTDAVTRETSSDPLFVTVRMTPTEPLLVTSFSEAGQLEEVLGERPTCSLGAGS